MRRTEPLITLSACLVLGACASTTTMSPPIAEKTPHTTEIHGLKLVDDYFWLRDRDDPKVIDYLNAENAYAEGIMASTEAFQKSLYDEMLGRIKEDDDTVPYKRGEYWYYARTESKKPYQIYCRKKGSLEAPEQVILDVNVLAEGHEYISLGLLDVSPDQTILAYSVDYNGAERFDVRFRRLDAPAPGAGDELPDVINNTYYSSAWGNDNKTFFYVTVDDATRPYKLFRHVLGTNPEDDVLVLHDPDDAFFLSVDKSLDDAVVLVELESAVTTEVHFIDANTPLADPTIVHPRQQGMEYYVDHHGDRFFIRTNDDALNFKLMEAPVASPGKASWREVIGHREDVTIDGVDAFADFLVLSERQAGLPYLTIRQLADGRTERIPTDEAAWEMSLGTNAEFATQTVRYEYESLITPESTFEYDVISKARTLKKTKVVIGYDRSGYATERLIATAADGTSVPISVVYKKGTPRDGTAPMLLNGYGSYGSSYDTHFAANWLSLMDRGMVVGIAHVRGGGEMGRRWKEDGKFEKKMNTFTDFIACAEHLIASKYTSADRLAISGRSAGGLLMGAVSNLRPDLFHVVLAGVPFVDVVNTMLDETIPLTVIEWEEWGNPKERRFFDVIRAYSPYDNVKAQDYPNMLLLAGLNDPRVAYWEPAKWAAKLRVTKTDDNLLVLKTNMGAGHGGASGRYGRLKERAYEYAFLLARMGITE